MTPLSDLVKICDLLHINFDLVTNVYNFGSHVHGTATIDSDFDLMIVGNIKQRQLIFKKPRDPYFAEYQLYNINLDEKKYDITIYSNENFELMIKQNFMIIIESLFNKAKFIPINKIDYKQIYITKYMNDPSIRRALQNELNYSLFCYKKYTQNLLSDNLDSFWVVKKLFNALRYHESCLQLLQDREIYDVTKLNNVKNTITQLHSANTPIKEIYDYIYDLINIYNSKIKTVIGDILL